MLDRLKMFSLPRFVKLFTHGILGLWQIACTVRWNHTLDVSGLQRPSCPILKQALVEWWNVQNFFLLGSHFLVVVIVERVQPGVPMEISAAINALPGHVETKWINRVKSPWPMMSRNSLYFILRCDLFSSRHPKFYIKNSQFVLCDSFPLISTTQQHGGGSTR